MKRISITQSGITCTLENIPEELPSHEVFHG